MSLSRQDDDQSFFTKERERLSREISVEALGMTKEYDTVAALWGAFHEMMRGPDAGDITTTSQEGAAGIPGTGGYTVTATPAAKEKNRDNEA
ncbi:hypothetical protein BD626DRAFT_502602 [Schizophyllum amplum]|uniref:Outer kinetochore protein DAD1 n=1 Tax=Schizophyllum amplum TaxID=97359 RepID=A0A550C8E2_9AGAR|nr:hypothetical protein BD626DRAFT_502602 [Auriculariopsis ampla]